MDENDKLTKLNKYLDLKLIKINSSLEKNLEKFKKNLEFNYNLFLKTYNNKVIEDNKEFESNMTNLKKLMDENATLRLQIKELISSNESIKDEIMEKCVQQLITPENLDIITTEVIKKLEI